MKKILGMFIVSLFLLNSSVFAKPKEIQEFTLANKQFIATSAQNSLKQFYKEFYSGEGNPLATTNFASPYIIAVYAKDALNNKKQVVAIGFPSTSSKEAWDFVIYEYKNDKPSKVIRQGGAVFNNIEKDLLNEARNAFITEGGI